MPTVQDTKALSSRWNEENWRNLEARIGDLEGREPPAVDEFLDRFDGYVRVRHALREGVNARRRRIPLGVRVGSVSGHLGAFVGLGLDGKRGGNGHQSVLRLAEVV